MELTYDIPSSKTCGMLRLKGRILSDEGLSEVVAGIAAGEHNWLCDLSELTCCNSTGLSLFVRIFTKSGNAGGDCALINLQPGVRQLFGLSRLNEIFTSYASVEEALSRYNTIA